MEETAIDLSPFFVTGIQCVGIRYCSNTIDRFATTALDSRFDNDHLAR
jgi:hypothetical protein